MFLTSQHSSPTPDKPKTYNTDDESTRKNVLTKIREDIASGLFDWRIENLLGMAERANAQEREHHETWAKRRATAK